LTCPEESATIGIIMVLKNFMFWLLTIRLCLTCSGFVLRQASNLNANGKRKASMPTEDNQCWEVKAKFNNLTYWNHDSLPSKDDTFFRSFHWFSIAEAVSV